MGPVFLIPDAIPIVFIVLVELLKTVLQEHAICVLPIALNAQVTLIVSSVLTGGILIW